jgi:hypothetical protein
MITLHLRGEARQKVRQAQRPLLDQSQREGQKPAKKPHQLREKGGENLCFKHIFSPF